MYCPEELGAGIELSNGDIETIEVERSEDSARLTLVKSPPPVTSPPQRAKQPPAAPVTPVIDDDDWPDPPAEDDDQRVKNDQALEIIDLLEGKQIAYDVMLRGGDVLILANSFNEKELLKAHGFRWLSEQKRWGYKFRNEPY